MILPDNERLWKERCMKVYGLGDRWRDQELERSILAVLARDPRLYWELIDLLPSGAFAHEAIVWDALSSRLEKEDDPGHEVPEEWIASPAPSEAAERLADLHQRRLLAGAQERLAEALADPDVPAGEVAGRLEEEAAWAQRAIRELASGRMLFASDLVADVVADARERFEERKDTGRPVSGIRSGIPRLDEITGGMVEGLYLLGAGPGAGKTTLATLKARAAAREGVPVVFVTFENSPANLVLKMLCVEAGINTRDVQRGYADPDRLAQAGSTLAPILGRIAIVEGTGRLTVAQVRARALQLMNRHGSDKVLIIADYLQLWAKASAELRGLVSVRERVEALTAELRQLAARLKNPVLAIASQNRAGAGVDYRRNGGATLDSLKESGDLEYTADVVMFLGEAPERTAAHPARAVDLTVAKNRNGEVGRVELIFRPDLGVMLEAAPAQANGHAVART